MERLAERGAELEEVISVVEQGERIPAKFGRTCFRRNFPFSGLWLGKAYHTKQIEAFAVEEGEDWLVITVIARYF
jgi:hypothetical protein